MGEIFLLKPDEIFQHLEESVRNGHIHRYENKGKVTYKDPESAPRGKSKHGLKLGPGCDLTKIFVKVRILFKLNLVAKTTLES